MPYLWPGRDVEGWAEMRVRVAIAMVFLVAAKVAIVYVPILFKEAVDALTKSPENLVIAVPIGVLVAYGLARVLSVAFGELRDAVFAKVAHRAIRTVALRVFQHLHALALRYHLDRRTGGLSRSIERGTKGIEFLLSFMLFNIIPTLMEKCGRPHSASRNKLGADIKFLRMNWNVNGPDHVTLPEIPILAGINQEGAGQPPLLELVARDGKPAW